jgi:hypothetical protein
VKDDHSFLGLRLGYEYSRPNCFYGAFDFLSSVAESQYKASIDGKEISLAHDDTWLGDLELRFGYPFLLRNSVIIPFFGVGAIVVEPYKKQHEGLKVGLPMYIGGIRSKYALSPCLDIGMNIKILRINNGEIRYKYRDVKESESIDKWGGEISLPFTWSLGCRRKWIVNFEPFYLRLTFAEKQELYGFKCLLGYRF